MRDDGFGSGNLNLYGWIGDEVMFEAIRNNIARHGDISLKLRLPTITVKLLHIEQGIFAESSCFNLLLWLLRLLGLKLLHGLLLIDFLEHLLTHLLVVVKPHCQAFYSVFDRSSFRKTVIATEVLEA